MYRINLDLHRWATLIVALQVLAWFGGGLLMTAAPIERVRGEPFIAEPAKPALPLDDVLSPAAAAAAAGVDAPIRAELKVWLDRPVYLFETADALVLVDARDADRLSPIDEASARAVAEADLLGEAAAVRATLVTDPPIEFRRPGPVWRVDFDDARGSTIWISPSTGEVAARRSTLWRIYDVAWMLHTMDYRGRDDFNTPWVVGFAAVSTFVALTGLVLLILRYGGKLGRAVRRA